MPCYRQMTAVIWQIFVDARVLTVVFPTLSSNGIYNAEAPELVPLPGMKNYLLGAAGGGRKGSPRRCSAA